MIKNIANWKELEAEIISADVRPIGSVYKVFIRYRYYENNTECFGEYISRELATVSIAKSYAEVALRMSCPI